MKVIIKDIKINSDIANIQVVFLNNDDVAIGGEVISIKVNAITKTTLMQAITEVGNRIKLIIDTEIKEKQIIENIKTILGKEIVL